MATTNTETPVQAVTTAIEARACSVCKGSGKLSGVFYRAMECDSCDAVGFIQAATGQWLDSFSVDRIMQARRQEETLRKKAHLEAARKPNSGTPDTWTLKNNLRLD
ncbi:hypothetical protein [Endozoicomonas lisbonensis]|uniref:hypothetical protein n=1 Tax=Endozoicomonas lisbonensis TaxID=3120522 RepID=UPI00339818B7